MDDFKWMSYEKAAAWEEEAERQGVSKVARGEEGFMRAYGRLGGSKSRMWKEKVKEGKELTWGRKRLNFIKRTLPLYLKNPTERRWLTLVMWAYMPPRP